MAKMTFNYSNIKTPESLRIVERHLMSGDLTDAEWMVLKLEGVIARLPAHVKKDRVQKKPVQNRQKSQKVITAQFVGHGFKFVSRDLIESNSKTRYRDPDAYKEKRYRDEVYDILQSFQPGIAAVLKNKRIKPGSLRITFSFEE